MPELFAKTNLMGTFKGFSEKGYEFAAEIVTPYDALMIENPQLGQFLLIELGNPEEASLGRITKFIPSGLLSTAEGEDYINTMQRRDQKVPEDLKKDKLKYKVQIKLLGVVKVVKEDNERKKIVFVPSHRRLPHLGAKVALPSNEVLEALCSLNKGETDLGHYVLGEFVYSGATGDPSETFTHLNPQLSVKFNIKNLVSKRSVVFARAGYGKSNLIKYLISELYKENGKNAVTEKGNKVGTLIFDAEGEYFWPDHNNCPGLCDVPHLREKLTVFTSRIAESEYYKKWKVGGVKLNIRDLPARDVIGIAISSDRQEQQNIIKLKSLSTDDWKKLVNLISRSGLQAPDADVAKLLGRNNDIAKVEITAAKSNMNNVVKHLHDPDSKLIEDTITDLQQGRIVVIDISLLSSSAGYNVAALLMRKIFNHNQENFTGSNKLMPVNVIIEEAQSVLGKSLEESSPFVEWVKEGRKYDLGAILVTQQPGSMAPAILSQSDNWFSFHLLSKGDASTLGKYNSHYSHDVLAHLIGEPIPGNCYMWSAPKQPFVLPVRIKDFKKLYQEHIIKDTDMPSFEASPAKEIRKRSEERNSDLAEALKTEMLATPLSKLEFGNRHTGVYYGQLYKLLNNVKKKKAFTDEIRQPDELYIPILSKLFNTTDVSIKKGNHPKRGEQDYYCVPKDKWKKILDV